MLWSTSKICQYIYIWLYIELFDGVFAIYALYIYAITKKGIVLYGYSDSDTTILIITGLCLPLKTKLMSTMHTWIWLCGGYYLCLEKEFFRGTVGH